MFGFNHKPRSRSIIDLVFVLFVILLLALGLVLGFGLDLGIDLDDSFCLRLGLNFRFESRLNFY